MLDEKQFQRLYKNILTAIQTNDIRKLTIPSCQWILENYWLRPQDYWDLMYDFREYSRKDFEKFFATFNLREWFVCEIDLNHALTWILHWIQNKQGDCESVRQCIENFKQRCKLVQLLRNAIGLKQFHVHFLSKEHHWRRGNIYKKHVLKFYATDIKDALASFHARWKNNERTTFKVQRVRMVWGEALYRINKEPRMSDNLFKYLINNDVEYKDETFGWPNPYQVKA